jgi:hypothetical protein
MRNKGEERLKLYILLGAVIWTCIVVASLIWNIKQTKDTTITRAGIMAQLSFDKDISFRTWANFHGGVYVPITEETKPNPYLNVPDRDIQTNKGKSLTLLNPAYIMRQYYEGFEKKDGVRGHITSLKPIRPENAPDQWEEMSLKAFEKGEKEAMSIQTIEGTEYVRLMKPFIVTKGCLKCHAGQGYKEGDIRGGISTSVPMTPMRSIENNRIAIFMKVHIFLWLMGMVGIAIFGQNIVKREKKRYEAEEERKRLIIELQEALANVKTLSGMLPICAWCKKVRDDKGYWNQIETYIKDHSGVDFSHSICPECLEKRYPESNKKK